MPCGLSGYRSSCGRRCDPGWTGSLRGQAPTQHASACFLESVKSSMPLPTDLPRRKNAWMRLFPHIMDCSPLACPAREEGSYGKTCAARPMIPFSLRGLIRKIPFGNSHTGWTSAFPKRPRLWRARGGFRIGGPFSFMHARLLSLRITRYRRWNARRATMFPPPSPIRMPHPMDAV